VHLEIPGQREAVDSFLLQIGVLRNSESANGQDASYLDPARSTTVNNAGVDQAGRDDTGDA
jgi:hypothetical protein